MNRLAIFSMTIALCLLSTSEATAFWRKKAACVNQPPLPTCTTTQGTYGYPTVGYAIPSGSYLPLQGMVTPLTSPNYMLTESGSSVAGFATWHVTFRATSTGNFREYLGSPYSTYERANEAYNMCLKQYGIGNCSLYGYTTANAGDNFPVLAAKTGWRCNVKYKCNDGYESTTSGVGDTKEDALKDAKANADYGCYNRKGVKEVTVTSYEQINR